MFIYLFIYLFIYNKTRKQETRKQENKRIKRIKKKQIDFFYCIKQYSSGFPFIEAVYIRFPNEILLRQRNPH